MAMLNWDADVINNAPKKEEKTPKKEEKAPKKAEGDKDGKKI